MILFKFTFCPQYRYRAQTGAAPGLHGEFEFGNIYRCSTISHELNPKYTGAYVNERIFVASLQVPQRAIDPGQREKQ